MNFGQKIRAIFASLGFTQAAQNNSVTNEQWAQVSAAYEAKYGTSLMDDAAADQANTSTEETPAAPSFSQEQLNTLNSALGTLNAALSPQNNQASTEESSSTESDGDNDTTASTAPQQPAQASPESVAALADQLTQHLQQAAPDIPVATATQTVMNINGPGTTETHLFGIENRFFNMSDRWNQIANNPAHASLSEPSPKDETAFRQQVCEFSMGLRDRFRELHQNHQLDSKRLAAGEFANNRTGFAANGIPDQYLTLRQDALIARILEIRDVTQFFPVRYGVQDREVMFNAFFESVSQAYQSGEVFKGGMDIEPEIGYVDDAMIKLKFGTLKSLEREYIAYLNKEGSDPIKWSMIEFAILNALEQAQEEQNRRRILGHYIKPTPGKPGHEMYASTGMFYTLVRYYHEHKMKLHDHSSYMSYTSATMVDAVMEFTKDAKSSATRVKKSLKSHKLYLNEEHKSWWLEGLRKKFAQDNDFSGVGTYENKVPDTNMEIIWLPHLDNLCFMMIHKPNNIQFLEYVPGEMYSMSIDRMMETVYAWSVWKEGTAATFVGRQFANAAELTANKYKYQDIFMNKPATVLAADVTSFDGLDSMWVVTGANTAVKTLAEITDAAEGVAYVIECGSTENATKITKGDKWTITADYTPTAVGDYIMVALDPDGNYLEIERCVNGVRTINKAVQPNAPGARA